MPTYLSLDLDFFNARRLREKKFARTVEQELEKLGKFVKRYNVPCLAVMNHQQLLRHVDASGCDTLLNVDTHSDLQEEDVREYSCGSWVSYVSWREEGRYIWQTGNGGSYGDCSDGHHVFNCRSPRMRGWMTGWGEVIKVRDMRMPRLTKEITSVGVCISPGYIHYYEAAAEVFRAWVRKYGIRYLKGRVYEDFFVDRRPPKPKPIRLAHERNA